MPEYIGLDFETYGATDLPTHGLARYTGCKTFRPLRAGLTWYGAEDIERNRDLDMVEDYKATREEIGDRISGRTIVAHNAGFERAVLRWMDIDLPASRFIDSAVVARAAGAAGKLEAAAPQLLGIDKMEQGKHLISLFSIPSKVRRELGLLDFDRSVIELNPDEWKLFGKYCVLDSKLGLDIVVRWMNEVMPEMELEFQAVTMEMNEAGWPVDVDIVEEMQRRYQENQVVALANFRAECGAADLNLNSQPQLQKWCLERGIKANSFDEKHVAQLRQKIEAKLETMPVEDPKGQGYLEVVELMKTKQILGGAALKKLQVILDTTVDTAEGPRLKDQYLHIGAGQTWRTTGRSVQMQNLKRLAEPADMSELEDDDVEWDNQKLAGNMRQVFTASHPDGALIVGDFSSVESRGLAWWAGAQWKLEAYRQGKDMYKVLAADMFSVHYDDVLKSQRQAGKVGELSCGYGAGGGAIQSFASGMGIEMTLAEATKLKDDWRSTNPEVVDLWARLHEMLLDVVHLGLVYTRMPGPDGFVLELRKSVTPQSLRKQHPSAKSICLVVLDPRGRVFMRRYFHGCYMRGTNIGYYKPSELKSGNLWKNHFKDPKTKEVRFYEIYGGKLAGILTQSFCRELFMRSMLNVYDWSISHSNVALIGQFHDEMVVDWRPGPLTTSISLARAKADLEVHMSDPGMAVSFPLAAEIKHDYRYTK